MKKRCWKPRSLWMPRSEYVLWGAKALARRGNDLPQAKLTAETVREIRENRRGLTAKQQAELYGVHFRTITAVRERLTWGHVR